MIILPSKMLKIVIIWVPFLNADNKMNTKIDERIAKGNKAYYANAKLIKSKLLIKSNTNTTNNIKLKKNNKIKKRNNKIKIYKIMIRPVITYSSETQTLTAKDENNLRIFERQILRKISGAVNTDNIRRTRNNMEIDKLIQGADIVRFTKAQRIKWVGHIQRMDQARPTRKLLD